MPSRMQPERTVLLDGGDRVRARSIVLANGVKWRDLDIPSANALVGRGIYLRCRAQRSNRAAPGKDVYLVGGGNSAGQAAMYFSNYARRVTLLVRGRSLADSMSHYLIQQLATKDNIEVRTRTRIVRVEGELRLEAIVVENRDTRQLPKEPASAVFVLIGADAETAWLPRDVIRDEKGYVCTGRDVMDLMANAQGSWPLQRDPTCSRPACPAFSLQATCATARSSASPRVSAKAAWPSHSCINTWRACSNARLRQASVIPAKAGIHSDLAAEKNGSPLARATMPSTPALHSSAAGCAPVCPSPRGSR